MGWLKDFKEGYDGAQATYDPTAPTGPLAELAARPLPQLAADLFAACFAPDTKGWAEGLSQTRARKLFLDASGLGSTPSQPDVADALVAEAFQLLEHRGLLCLYLADGSETVHVHWYVTRAGRAAAKSGDLRRLLESEV